MNCAECRENLIACAEGLLSREEARECHAHLESCAECRAEYRAVTSLQQRLIVRGQSAAQVSIVEPVMRQVLQNKEEKEKETIMSLILKHRWGFGLGTMAAATAIVLAAFLALPQARATATEIMTRGAQTMAKLTTVHLRGQLRTLPQDNFSYINPDRDFVPVELWKQFEPTLKWRIEKPNRVVVMDGQSTVMLIKPRDGGEAIGVKFPRRSTSAFDTEWLHRIADLSTTLSNQLRNAQDRSWKLDLSEETGTDGRLKSVVTVMAKTDVPNNDYCRNTFLQDADTRRVYRFDAQSERLEAVQVYLEKPGGEVLIFDLSHIDYNQPIDPSVWHLKIPADVKWATLPGQIPVLPDNEKYASMTAEEAAHSFFEACSREDWTEAEKFMSPITDRVKEYLGGLKIISLGESFTSQAYGGRFVPYEIELRGFVKKHNLALRKDNAAGRWQVDGGL